MLSPNAQHSGLEKSLGIISFHLQKKMLGSKVFREAK